MNSVAQALHAFTHRYCELWRAQRGTQPASHELYAIVSPCIVQQDDDRIFWSPQPFAPANDLSAVERALDIIVRPEGHQFYTTQFAGDMAACFQEQQLTLLQTWSPADFERVQQNLIGHLVTQRRLKLPPTVFLATLDSETEIIALSNLTGEVVLEKLGVSSRTLLAPSLSDFVNSLQPVLK